MRTLVAVAFIVSTAAGFGFGYALHPEPARADKTITLQSAGATWDAFSYWPDAGGGIRAEICAHTTIQGGGVSATTCRQTTVGAANQIAIDATALAVSRGIPFWKAAEGL